MQQSILCAQAQQTSVAKELEYLSTLPQISQKVLTAKLQQSARSKHLVEDLQHLQQLLIDNLSYAENLIMQLQNACLVSGMRLIEVGNKPENARLTIADIAEYINNDPTPVKVATKPTCTIQQLKDLAKSNLVIT